MKSICATAALLLAMSLIGCDPAPRAVTKTDIAVSPATATVAARGTTEAPREIVIEAGDTMKFNLTRLEAGPGETLRVTLVNTGSAPKEAMGHNWVLLKAGVDATAYANEAIAAKETDYLPGARAADVIAHTRVLGPREREAVVFTLPTTPGEYVFLCSFPAHMQIGMKGLIVVK